MPDSKQRHRSCLQRLYLQSMDWWELSPEEQASQCTRRVVADYLHRWRDCVAAVWQAERASSETADIDHALRNALSNTNDLASDPALALYGFYLDLLDLLQGKHDQVNRYKLLAGVEGRTFSQQMADAHSVMGFAVESLGNINLADVTAKVRQFMHRDNDKGFSAAKVAILKVLECLKIESQAQAEEDQLRLILETYKISVHPVHRIKPVWIRWDLEGAAIPRGVWYTVTLTDASRQYLLFAPDEMFPQDFTRERKLENGVIEERLQRKGAGQSSTAGIHLRIFKTASDAQRQDLFSGTFDLELHYPPVHDGNLADQVYSLLHRRFARQLIETDEPLTFVVGTEERTGPLMALVYAIEEIQQEKRQKADALAREALSLLQRVQERESRLLQLGAQNAEEIQSLRTQNEDDQTQADQILEEEAIYRRQSYVQIVLADRIDTPIDKLCSLLVVSPYPAGQINEDLVNAWQARATQDPRPRLVLIEQCSEEDIVEHRNTRRSHTGHIRVDVLDDLIDELVDSDEGGPMWRDDCELLLSRALPGVTFDKPAHEFLLDLLEFYPTWSFRYLVLQKVAQGLKSNLPYVDLDDVKQVWDELSVTGDALKAFSRLDDIDERKDERKDDEERREQRRKVLIATWEVTYGRGLDPVTQATLGSIKDKIPEISTHDLKTTLDQLCEKRFVRREGFLYSPSPALLREHITALRQSK